MRPRQISFALRTSDRSAIRRTRGRLNIGKNAANRLLGVVKSCEPFASLRKPAGRERRHAPRDIRALGINPQSKQSCPAGDPPAFPADRDGSEAYCNHDRRSPVRSARCEHPERPQFGGDGFGRGIGAVSHHIDRPSASVAPAGGDGLSAAASKPTEDGAEAWGAAGASGSTRGKPRCKNDPRP